MSQLAIASDLHGHTLYSDGRATPLEYVDFRREQGMRAIAISDHDHFAAVREGAALAAPRGMLFLPASEITSFVHFGTPEAEQIHIVAYFAPDVLASRRLESTELYRRGERVRQAWKDFVLEWVSALPADDRETVDPGGALGRLDTGAFPALQTLLDLLMKRDRRYFEDFRSHHVRFWTEGRELFGWQPEEAVDAIRSDGATPIVAHPGRYRDRARVLALIDHAGGCEAYTSRHKPEVAAAFRAYAEERGKLWTASSDDHQNAPYARPPCGTPVATLERILRRPLPSELVINARV